MLGGKAYTTITMAESAIIARRHKSLRHIKRLRSRLVLSVWASAATSSATRRTCTRGGVDGLLERAARVADGSRDL